MPNSDNAHGTFNKFTSHFSQVDDGSTPLTIFSSIDQAKSYFYTTEALAVWDECGTTLQWALLADGNGDNTKLKVTVDFGTKGNSDIAEADDWAGLYNSRKTALIDSNGWFANPTSVAVDQTDHLF